MNGIYPLRESTGQGRALRTLRALLANPFYSNIVNLVYLPVTFLTIHITKRIGIKNTVWYLIKSPMDTR